jgi:hypothetical protein
MPGVEDRIRDTLDRLGDQSDTDRILAGVAHRRRRIRTVRRVQTVALVAAVVVGVAGGVFALLRTFGAGISHPIPVTPPSVTASPAPSRPSPTVTPSGTPAIEACAAPSVRITVASSDTAAGTQRTGWKITNRGTEPCSSEGYPAMDFHAASGWLGVQVSRGGHPDISQAPTRVVVQPGASVYFVSYWSDATTQSGPCTQFDAVRVTLPGTTVPAEVTTSGCVSPSLVNVGPMTATPPS